MSIPKGVMVGSESKAFTPLLSSLKVVLPDWFNGEIKVIQQRENLAGLDSMEKKHGANWFGYNQMTNSEINKNKFNARFVKILMHKVRGLANYSNFRKFKH